MRYSILCSAAAILIPLSPACAADKLAFGKAPAWVIPQAIPAESTKSAQAPVAMLLSDQQIQFEPGRMTTFTEVAIKIQTPEGLSAGNISIPWNPATDTVTVNRLEIHRGTQVIDVLASGQSFTTMRRESNLELATLDGLLTANIQPDGLQQGDVIDLATTAVHVDPILGNHVETTFGQWGAMSTTLAHARLEWPAASRINIQTSGGLPSARPETRARRVVLEMFGHDVDPIIAPKNAPSRFKLGRFGEATDFASWADLSRLVLPLFRKAEMIAAAGPLHDEVEKIRASTADPKLRATAALQLVEQRVRYVALVMGRGSYEPAAADVTWSRRFGDCKAKTALLLGILHSLGIEAEAILVQSRQGDAIAERLPLLSYFDHVLVRSRVGGKTYFLDGTRTGDMGLDDIEVPYFGWGLPLIADAKLVAIVPPPRRVPDAVTAIDIDLRGGVLAPAPVTMTQTFHGDAAVAFDAVYAQLSSAQHDQMLTEATKAQLTGFKLGSSSVKFDKPRRVMTIQIVGTAPPDWKNGWLNVPGTSIAYTPDFDRPAGPLHDAPIKNSFPAFTQSVTRLRLPPGFAAQQKLPTAVKETLAGVEFARTVSKTGDDLVSEASERTLVPEIAYKDALAAANRLKSLNDDDVYLRMVANYQPKASDWQVIGERKPASADDLVSRGNVYLDGAKFDLAIADFDQALALQPQNKIALADRALAYAFKNNLPLARKDAAAALAIDPHFAVGHRAVGVIAANEGDYKAAVASFTESLRTEPENIFALGRRASARNDLGDEKGALEDSEAALKLNPSNIDFRIFRANIFIHQGKLDLVAREAEAIMQVAPASDYAMVAAAKSYAAIGRPDDATRAFDKAIAIKPQAYIYLNRSQIRAPADLKARLADLEAALKIEPGDADVLREKARLLSRAGDYRAALAALDAAKPSPDDPEAEQAIAIERAIVLQQAGQTATAQKLFAAGRAAAKTANQLNNLCWTEAIAGVGLDWALQECRDALKLQPADAATMDSLAMVLLKLGKLDEALAMYNQALAKRSFSSALMGRALVYAKKGDRVRAEADAAAARKLTPRIAETFAVNYGLAL